MPTHPHRNAIRSLSSLRGEVRGAKASTPPARLLSILALASSLLWGAACGPVDSDLGEVDGAVATLDAAVDAGYVGPDADAYVYPDAIIPLNQDVEVLITADNAYGFGYGTEGEMLNYFGGVAATTAGEIFNCPVGNGPEAYTVPAADANAGNYLYVVAWADSATSQGVLGQFRRTGINNPPVYTGSGAWEVCATGVNYTPSSGGPDLSTINTQLTACNAQTGDPSTTSAGWVDALGAGGGVGALAAGEDNTTPRTTVEPGNEFPVVCEIDGEAHWMWYNWDPTTVIWPTSGSPFIWPSASGDNPDKQFLIFRLRAEEIPIVQ